jgi:hypothetical protein
VLEQCGAAERFSASRALPIENVSDQDARPLGHEQSHRGLSDAAGPSADDSRLAG